MLRLLPGQHNGAVKWGDHLGAKLVEKPLQMEQSVAAPNLWKNDPSAMSTHVGDLQIAGDRTYVLLPTTHQLFKLQVDDPFLDSGEATFVRKSSTTFSAGISCRTQLEVCAFFGSSLWIETRVQPMPLR